MRLPFRFVLSCLLGLIVCLLFQISQNVQSAEDHLRNLEKNIIEEQEKIRVYNAEWAYLTRPERLEKLAERYTKLRSIDGSNILNVSVIPLHETMVAAVENSETETETNPTEYRIQAMDMRPDIVKKIRQKQRQLAARAPKKATPITVAFQDIWGGNAP